MAEPYPIPNEVQGTLASDYVHGTDAHLHLAAIGLFDAAGGFIRVKTTDGVHWALLEHTGVSTNDLTGLTQANLTGLLHTDAAYTFPAGAIVERAQMGEDVSKRIMGPASATNNTVALFDGTSGKKAKAAAASTTTTHALFATAGSPAFRAIVAGDLPARPFTSLSDVPASYTGYANYGLGVNAGESAIEFTLRMKIQSANVTYLIGATGAVLTMPAAPTAEGTGYTVGDLLTIVQAGGAGATIRVLTVDAGKVKTYSLISGGAGYSAAAGLATTGGTGANCTVEISTVYAGTAPDYATLALAAEAIKYRTLVGNIVLQLVNNIKVTTMTTFTGLISMGGYLELDLNGKTITVDHGGSSITYGLVFQGPFYSRIIGNSTIKASVNFPTVALVKWEYDNGGFTYQTTFDADSRAMQACIYVQERAKVLFYTSTAFSNTASLTAALVMVSAAGMAASSVTVASWSVVTGSMAITSAGVIVTSGGTITPVP